MTEIFPKGRVSSCRNALLVSLAVGRTQDQLRETLSQVELGEFEKTAIRNRVAPIVAHAEREAGIIRSDFHQVHERSMSRMRVLLLEVDIISKSCANEGIRIVALKNAGIARGIYPCQACCPMGDADLLVERERFREAHNIMLGCGYAHASRASVEPAVLELGIASGGTEYFKKIGSEEVWIELQWRPIAGRWIRKDQEPDGAEMIRRSVPVPGTDVRLLDPSDNMLQVCLHTAKHSYVRAPGIRLHTDVDRLVAFAPPDWDRVVVMACELGVKTPVYFSLVCSAELLGTPVPMKVLETLAPAAWKRRLVMGWLRKLDFFEPDEKKFSRLGMMVFHALLYDDFRGLSASVLDTEPDKLGLKYLPGNIARGTRRMLDLATRYQR